MSKKNDGGPAFPGKEQRDRQGYLPARYEGMTLRDWLAGQALNGMLSVQGLRNDATPIHIAIWAYECADAMLKARGE